MKRVTCTQYVLNLFEVERTRVRRGKKILNSKNIEENQPSSKYLCRLIVRVTQFFIYIYVYVYIHDTIIFKRKLFDRNAGETDNSVIEFLCSFLPTMENRFHDAKEDSSAPFRKTRKIKDSDRKSISSAGFLSFFRRME